MNYLLKIALLLLLPAFAQAQQRQKELDSLHQALMNSANDTIEMNVCGSFGRFYSEANRDSSLFYFENAALLARKLNLKLDEANMLKWIGYILIQLRNYHKSLEYHLQALKILEDQKSEKNTWHLLSGQSPRTYRLFILADTHLGLGLLYGATGNTSMQISSYLKCRTISKSIEDIAELAFVNLTLGETYLRIGKLDSALLLEQDALVYFSNTSLAEDRKYAGMALLYIGQVYHKKGNYDLARDTITKAIKVSEELNNLSSLGDAYFSMASLYQDQNKHDLSLVYASKSLETYKGVERPDGIAKTYTLLSSVYKSQNKTDSAFAYLKLAIALNDSLDNAERNSLLAYQNIGFNEQLRLEELEKEKILTQSKIRTYAMVAGLGVFFVIGLILYRNNRQKQKANKVLETTLSNLKSTQSQLIQSEKMASLGELTAGIAHEIQNPLNFVNNFSEVNKELLAEMNQEIGKENYEEVKAIAKDVTDNEEKINHHGKRADAIVKGMLLHSRSSSGVKAPTDINALADEYLRLAYHGLRAKDKTFSATMKTEFDESIGDINIIPQDIGRVILNLITNAFYAVTEKNASTLRLAQGSAGQTYEPTVTISTKKAGNSIRLTVKDNGNGIPQNVLDKIFQPFFTTKPTGQGTGLGLSLSYDVIKAHGGELRVETKEGEGAAFIMILPVNTTKGV